MLPGVYTAVRKNGTLYYRSSINYHSKHISLGSFPTEGEAARAYREASFLLSDASVTIHNVFDGILSCPDDTKTEKNTKTAGMSALSPEKAVILLNFRDNGLYIKNPIYLRKGYFSYFLSPSIELKFDIDDLFYYSSHKIQKRQGYLFVSDYGTQYSILGRCGIRPYAVAGRDYEFANGDPFDFRYSNMIIRTRFHGVVLIRQKGKERYRARIHINGTYIVGTYESEEKAAVAYNKAADLAKAAGIRKNFPENYVDAFSPKEYAQLYTELKLSRRYLQYLRTRRTAQDKT